MLGGRSKGKFKACLGYIVRQCLKRTMTNIPVAQRAAVNTDPFRIPKDETYDTKDKPGLQRSSRTRNQNGFMRHGSPEENSGGSSPPMLLENDVQPGHPAEI